MCLGLNITYVKMDLGLNIAYVKMSLRLDIAYVKMHLGLYIYILYILLCENALEIGYGVGVMKICIL